jgi:hypothetical protein
VPLTSAPDFNRRQLGDILREIVQPGEQPYSGQKVRPVENLGYVLSEVPLFFLVIWFAITVVRYRRYRKNQPVFSEKDRQLFLARAPVRLDSPEYRLRLVRAILAATASTCVLFVVLAPFGAAIITAALILSGAAIVRWMLMIDS